MTKFFFFWGGGGGRQFGEILKVHFTNDETKPLDTIFSDKMQDRVGGGGGGGITPKKVG